MNQLLAEIKSCTVCLPFLEHGVNPTLSASKKSSIIVIGQAPGSVVHRTGIPWDDKSGDRLRDWLGVSKDAFYDEEKFGLVPMGFCYPGKGKSGDLPPRQECAPLWHNRLLHQMDNKKLILLVGQYAQNYYLKSSIKSTLTDTVKCYSEYLPLYFPLPHPSPRNNIWLKKNSWFEESIIPALREMVKMILSLDSSNGD